MNYVSVNGKFIAESEPALLSSNRSYRYGYGLFETMKWINGRIQLESFHFDRFFAGLDLLKIYHSKYFTAEKLKSEIANLCIKNKCTEMARIRVSVSGGNGGLFDVADTSLFYIIETWPLSETANQLNENGLALGIYKDARKSMDKFSNLKSANFLPYAMAALYAGKNKFNDCVVLNQEGRIADSTIANIFLIKDDFILTPSLAEACVAGTMRSYLVNQLKESGMPIEETKITLKQLKEADEIFMTNAIRGIQWVKEFDGEKYTCSKTAEIYRQYIHSVPL